MASTADSEGKDDLMDLSPFMHNYVLNNPFSASGLISSNTVDEEEATPPQSQLHTGYVGSNMQYAVSLKKQWLAPKHHPVRQWLKKEFIESPTERVSADLVYKEAVKRFPNLSPQLLTRIVRATFPNVNKVPTRRGCTFQGMGDRLKKNRYTVENQGKPETMVKYSSQSLVDSPPEGETEWWGSEEEDLEQDSEWTPSSAQKDHTPSKRWNLRKRNHSVGSISTNNIKRPFFARSISKAKAVLRSKSKTEVVGVSKCANPGKEFGQGDVSDSPVHSGGSVESSSIKSEVCEELPSYLPRDRQVVKAGLAVSPKPTTSVGSAAGNTKTQSSRVAAGSPLSLYADQSSASMGSENGCPPGELSVHVKEEPIEDAYEDPATDGTTNSSVVISDLQRRITEVEAELNTARLQCQAQTLRNEQLVGQLVKTKASLQQRSSQVATLGAQFLELSNQFNKISHQFQVLLFDIQSEEGSTGLQNGS